MKSIESIILGTLIKNEQIENWWQSKAINIPLIDSKLRVAFVDFEPDSDHSFIKEADSALESFLKLDLKYRDKITPHVFNHFLEFKDLVEIEDIPNEMTGIKKLEIWKFINPIEITITRRPYNKPDIFISMECECLWEPEHGLQLVFKKGQKLTRVSDQDGHLTKADAYDIPDSEDELLSKF
jgi:Domain of unknown function (DUF6985)